MISVIIPTCDRPIEFLLEALRSVLGQSLPPTEVLVIDNGSRDVDLAALPEGVTLYRLPPRVGPSRARNFGAAMARGSHLAFLDDDDWWHADFLSVAWSVLVAEKARCVYGRKDIWRSGKQLPYKTLTERTLTVPVLLRINPGTGGINILIEKALYWRVGGFDERLHTSEDKALALEVLQTGERIALAPNAIAVVREHGGSRLRHAQLARLRFVWKYRNLLGGWGTVLVATGIVRTTLKSHLRKYLRPKRT